LIIKFRKHGNSLFIIVLIIFFSFLCYSQDNGLKSDWANKAFLTNGQDNKPIHTFYNSSCMCCHLPDNIQKEDEANLCLKCHDKRIISKTGEFENIKEQLQKKNVHQPVSNGCMDCHKPHTSDTGNLLNSQYNTGTYVNGTTEVFSLCFQCHDNNMLLSEKADKETNFRNGTKNLHWIHVKRDKGINCIVCHDVHGSNAGHLIRDNSKFGNWSMPINYAKENDGGSCATGCHQKRSYSLHPVDISQKSDEKIQESTEKIQEPGDLGNTLNNESISFDKGLDKDDIEGLSIHIMKKDSSLSEIISGDNDFSIEKNNLPPGEYIAWIDKEDLSDINAVTKDSITNFKINPEQSQNSSIEIKSVVQNMISDIKTTGNTQNKNKIIPNKTKVFNFKKLDLKKFNPEMKSYVGKIKKYVLTHKKSKLHISIIINNQTKFDETQELTDEQISDIINYLVGKGIPRDKIISTSKCQTMSNQNNKNKLANKNNSNIIDKNLKNVKIEMKIIK
jgi:predicted CXXCH cytochrome family protein